MNDLDEKEQKHVRTAMRFLRRRIGTWASVADGLRMSVRTLETVVSGRGQVTASVALRVARLANTPFDDLVAGHFMPGACPRCGYVPDFADDETTNVEAAPRPKDGVGLKLVP